MTKIEWQVENEYLLEKARAKGIEIRSFANWKAIGRFVRRGMRQKMVRVQAGSRSEMDPITGETYAEPIYKTAYGFTREQTAEETASSKEPA